MNRKNLSKPLIFLSFLMFGANYAAMRFYWYFSIPGSDKIMHFLGGVWVALSFIYLFLPEKITLRTFLKIITLTLFVGLAWEAFEYWLNIFTTQNPFDLFDTLTDILFDILGGAGVLSYLWKRQQR